MCNNEWHSNYASLYKLTEHDGNVHYKDSGIPLKCTELEYTCTNILCMSIHLVAIFILRNFMQNYLKQCQYLYNTHVMEVTNSSQKFIEKRLNYCAIIK